MECPKCKCEGDEKHFNPKLLDSGEGFNATFGITEYWHSLECTCPECKYVFEYSDSSL